MRYLSTRQARDAGGHRAASFEDILIAGLARDGGLFVPERWPRLSAEGIQELAGLDYPALAARVLEPFVADDIERAALEGMAREAYAQFDHAAVAPLVQLGPNRWLLELFHGPTLAFKDFALQLLGRFFDHVLARRGERLTIVGATSGDTGSAAIEACRDRDSLSIVILHPKGRISEVQRRQMTTVRAANVHNLAIDGTFDDCQALVKAMFNDLAFRDELKLGAVNSINWARVVAQSAYYVYAAVALGAPARAVAFTVPTGNFGDVYAGYVASRLGLPIKRLLVATNPNDILARFLASGEYRKDTVRSSLSPSMDIQVASNFERLIFELCGRDGAAVGALMGRLQAEGGFALAAEQLAEARALFAGHRVDDEQTLATIAALHRATGRLIDPHTATGVAAAAACWDDPAVPMICLATAHPAKFPDAVERATGVRPTLPPRLADLMAREEHFSVLPNELGAVQAFVRARAAAASGGTGQRAGQPAGKRVA